MGAVSADKEVRHSPKEMFSSQISLMKVLALTGLLSCDQSNIPVHIGCGLLGRINHTFIYSHCKFDLISAL